MDPLGLTTKTVAQDEVLAGFTQTSTPSWAVTMTRKRPGKSLKSLKRTAGALDRKSIVKACAHSTTTGVPFATRP